MTKKGAPPVKLSLKQSDVKLILEQIMRERGRRDTFKATQIAYEQTRDLTKLPAYDAIITNCALEVAYSEERICALEEILRAAKKRNKK
jgi:hypothetical protein